ncbi:MAG: hypothetical protein WKG07_39125 [Hymenobacter sp.]
MPPWPTRSSSFSSSTTSWKPAWPTRTQAARQAQAEAEQRRQQLERLFEHVPARHRHPGRVPSWCMSW